MCFSLVGQREIYWRAVRFKGINTPCLLPLPMQVKVDAISNGYTLTYWKDMTVKDGKSKGQYVTEFTGDWTKTVATLKTLVEAVEK
jgi:hypothetical protein